MPHAELSAIECALDMQRVLGEYNRIRVAEGQEEIRIGVGINTGQVVTGAIGSSRALQYTAIGDAVNTASRLCGKAAPDQILISEATYAKVHDRVTVEPLPAVRVRGKAEELQVWNAIGIRQRAGDTARPR
jgi:adenylate cyclase